MNLEQFVTGKTLGSFGEDMVEDLGSFVVLLDGVTGKDGSLFRGLTGGRFAAETVMGVVAGFPNDIDSGEAVKAVSLGLREAIFAEAGDMKHPPGTQFSMYSPARSEVWRVGDIHVRLGDVLPVTPSPPTDSIATAFRAALLEAMLLDGVTVDDIKSFDPSWDVILPLLSRQDVFANLSFDSSFGYGVVNGSPVPSRFVDVFSVPDGSEVVLASDGFLSAERDLVFAEECLANVLREDSLLIRRYRGFRCAPAGGSFDDRAWVRLLVG
jgi:hypothetical protein